MVTNVQKRSSRRLSKTDRRQQLLDTALSIVHNEGTDRLTMGNLALCAGVSKPVVYEHFGTRSGLLIELYKKIDAKRVADFQESMSTNKKNLDETIYLLASSYVKCATNVTDDFSVIGAALSGSEEKAEVYQELLENGIQIFANILKQFNVLDNKELEKRCIGFIGAGEALSVAVVRGTLGEDDAINQFAALIYGGCR